MFLPAWAMMGWNMSEYKPIGYAMALYAPNAPTKYLRLLSSGRFEWVEHIMTNTTVPPITLFRSYIAALSYADKHFPILASYMDVELVYEFIGRGCTKSCAPDYQFYEEDT